jgi:hypothetical protein
LRQNAGKNQLPSLLQLLHEEAIAFSFHAAQWNAWRSSRCEVHDFSLPNIAALTLRIARG